MSYFTNFPFVNYVFGNQPGPTVFQNMGVYVDLLDIAKDDAAFYTYYDIQNGDRPDQVSQKLYGRSDLHWTFAIMNDDIKIQGWPLSYNDLLQKAKDDYPNVTITTRTDVTSKFKVGSILTGSTGQSKGKIIRKRLDLGQIIVERVSDDYQITQTTDVKGYIKLELPSVYYRFTELADWIITKDGVAITAPTIKSGGANHTFIEYDFGKTNANTEYVFNTKILNYAVNPSFLSGEQITTTEEGILQSAIVDSSSLEYLATHHYEDANEKYVDINPNAPFVQRISVELELDGATDANVNNAVVKSISASTTLDYATNITLTDIQRNIDQGFYTITGSILKATVDAYNDVINIDITKTLDGLTGIGGATDNDFDNNFPSGTSLTELNSELRTELKAAVGVADTNSNSKYTVTVHMFFLIDNQLNIVLAQENAFGTVYEYKVGGVDTFKVAYTENEVTTVSSPAPTTQAEAWTDAATQLESYIQQNLSTFNPALLNQVTYFDRYERSNNALKSIRVLKPSIADELVKAFNDILVESQDFGDQVEQNTTVQGGSGISAVTASSQPVTTLAGQTVTSSSAAAVSSATSGSSSSSGGGYY
jgi:hypothetical protein